MTAKLRAVPATSTITRILSPRSNHLIEVSTSLFREFVVNRAQAAAQRTDRVMLAREQRVQADPGRCRQLLKTASFDFVGHKNLALLFGKFVDGRIQFIQKNLSRVG